MSRASIPGITSACYSLRLFSFQAGDDDSGFRRGDFQPALLGFVAEMLPLLGVVGTPAHARPRTAFHQMGDRLPTRPANALRRRQPQQTQGALRGPFSPESV